MLRPEADVAGLVLAQIAMLSGVAAVIAVISFAQSFFLFPFWPTFLLLSGASTVAAAIGYAATHVKYATGLDGYSFWQTLHLAAPKMKFYDLHLDNAVWYARHAMSIDETRADFPRVPWAAHATQVRNVPTPIPIGCNRYGSLEITQISAAAIPKTRQAIGLLGWMAHAARSSKRGVTDRLRHQVDGRCNAQARPLGPQHDDGNLDIWAGV
jgi:hypothetical protein